MRKFEHSVPYRLRCLNIWSPVGGTVCVVWKSVALWLNYATWRRLWGFKAWAIPISLSLDLWFNMWPLNSSCHHAWQPNTRTELKSQGHWLQYSPEYNDNAQKAELGILNWYLSSVITVVGWHAGRECGFGELCLSLLIVTKCLGFPVHNKLNGIEL